MFCCKTSCPDGGTHIKVMGMLVDSLSRGVATIYAHRHVRTSRNYKKNYLIFNDEKRL